MFIVEFFGSKGWDTVYEGGDLIAAMAKFRLASVEGDVRFTTYTEGRGGAFSEVDIFNIGGSLLANVEKHSCKV